jgi:hypothetical protein
MQLSPTEVNSCSATQDITFVTYPVNYHRVNLITVTVLGEMCTLPSILVAIEANFLSRIHRYFRF